MKVVVFSAKPFEITYLDKANKDNLTLVYEKGSLSSSTIELAKGATAVSVFTNDDCSAPILEELSRLGVRFIAVRAAGHDNVDKVRAKQLGIKVANVPEYSPYAIAEHAVGMMLAMNRKLVRADQKVKQYDFSLDDLIGFDMNRKSVGIIGCGKIGAIVARILHAFGCQLYIYDKVINPELEGEYDAKYVGLDELLKASDIVSIHAPLNEGTRYMINKESIQKMKEGVMIVNTGRGGIIDTQAAIEGLKSGRIGYLGLDVYEYEKPLFFYDHSKQLLKDDLFARLLTFKNVLITGHQAFLTETALGNIADTTLDNLSYWAKGNKPASELDLSQY